MNRLNEIIHIKHLKQCLAHSTYIIILAIFIIPSTVSTVPGVEKKILWHKSESDLFYDL